MVIAVDFDGTLFKTEYPKIVEPIINVINFCKNRKDCGDKLILWTCRTGKELEDAISECKKFGLIFDEVNNNLTERVKLFDGNDSRKVGADLYIDDKSVKPLEVRMVNGGLGKLYKMCPVEPTVKNIFRVTYSVNDPNDFYDCIKFSHDLTVDDFENSIPFFKALLNNELEKGYLNFLVKANRDNLATKEVIDNFDMWITGEFMIYNPHMSGDYIDIKYYDEHGVEFSVELL